MSLPVEPPVAPMLARAAPEIPGDGGWQYEPKWDGFRAVVFRDGERVELGSRNERPLTRYFPELIDPLRASLPARAVVDGEIVVMTRRGLDFDLLSQRIHPAESRVRRLAVETPAAFVAFDLLALGDDDLRPRPLAERRALLEAAVEAGGRPVRITPATSGRATAEDWFDRFEGAGLDGVVAKRVSERYREGERGWIKVKHRRTADCVVGGLRRHKDGRGVGSLLLGLHDASGVLHHVGVASSFDARTRERLLAEVEPLREGAALLHPWIRDGAPDGPGGRVPGAPSRWTGGRDLSWEPLRPERVVEVAYDHLQGDRFRHTTRLVRWRPDRDPGSCTYAQLEVPVPAELRQVFGG